jgi:hypothetical protein
MQFFIVLKYCSAVTGWHGCSGTECDGYETFGVLNTGVQIVTLWMSVIGTEEYTVGCHL